MRSLTILWTTPGIPGSACALLLAISVVACGDSPRRPLGDSCEESTSCESGLCYEARCVDPEGDDDGDGLVNRVELSLGSDLAARDTDSDGEVDPDEVGSVSAPRDADGDGRFDILESAIGDADRDCVPDERDAADAVADGRASGLVAETCGVQGVCGGAATALLDVRCEGGLDQPTCAGGAVSGYEATEKACDGLDNDCDGEVDEDCDPSLRALVARWALDGDGVDSGFFKFNGRVVGTSPAPDRFGVEDGAVRFDGTTDRIEVAASGHPTGEPTVTYSIWVRPDLEDDPWRSRQAAVFAWGTLSTPREASALVLRPGLGCATYIGGATEVAGQRVCAPGGHWSHLVVVKTGASVKLYLDGRLRDGGETGGGQRLAPSRLIIGAAQDGTVLPFKGVLDDLRVWGRALDAAEIGALYREGAWQDAGTMARPAAHCVHARDAVEAAVSGFVQVDIDGDGPLPAGAVWCDQETDGGGWALAWRYGFTAAEAFGEGRNAVTNAPAWGASVVAGEAPILDTGVKGALPFAAWRWLGREVRLKSALMSELSCLPGGGSVADHASGSVRCRVLAPGGACPTVVPSSFVARPDGPTLEGAGVFVRWDADPAQGVPVHDGCGRGGTQVSADDASLGGELWLRPTREPVLWARDCDGLEAVARTSGPQVVDPDGRGGGAPVLAGCDFGVERGGWTRLDGAMSAALLAVAGPREYLFRAGDAFYRSPMTEVPWDDADFAEVPGLWHYAGASGDGAFVCAGGGTPGAVGVGCSEPGDRVVVRADGGSDGVVSLCEGARGVLASGGDGCVDGVEVWVRLAVCPQAAGALTGDPGFDGLARASDASCWAATGPGGWFGGFALDRAEVAPEASAPSIRATNVSDTAVFALQLSQRRVSLVAGRTYRVAMLARASAPRAVRVVVRSRAALYFAHAEQVALTTAWQRVALTFDAPTTAWDAQLDLQFGGSSTEAVWVDDVRLEDVGAGVCGEGAGPNRLANGDFSDGRACWRLDQPATVGGWTLSVDDTVSPAEATLAPLGGVREAELVADLAGLEAGVTYRLALGLSSIDGGEPQDADVLHARVEQESWRQELEGFLPKASWESTEIRFTAPADGPGRLVFRLASGARGVRLRDVQVRPL